MYEISCHDFMAILNTSTPWITALLDKLTVAKLVK